MAVNDRRRGTNTPEYERFHSNFADIVDDIQAVLPDVAAKAFGKKLIAKSNVSEASNPATPSGTRASALVLILLGKIEHNADVFNTVMQILKSIPALETLVETLELPGAGLVCKSTGRPVGANPRLKEKPTNAEAFRALISISYEWKSIGTLLGIETAALKNIDNRRSDRECLIDMISEWFKMLDATWEGLIKAVKDLPNLQKAQEIERDFL